MTLLVARLTELLERTGDWAPLREGVEIRRLAGDPDAGATVALLRYRPGARVPAHHHPGFEVIYVLRGSQNDERGHYPTGTLVVNPRGVEHSVWSDDGCVVLIVWERSVEFTGETPEA
ncbi:MAG TPA: cupin domain-containing protein [Polyangiaceae bacterium]